MKSKIAYDHFISKAETSRSVFIASLEYLRTATPKEKRVFSQRINDIFFKCINKMLNEKLSYPEQVSDIYTRYGLNDSEFKRLFEQKLKRSDDPLVARFKNVVINQKNSNYQEIYEEAKKGLWKNEHLHKIADEKGISFKEVKEAIKHYVTYILKLNNDSFQEMKKAYCFFIIFGTTLKKYKSSSLALKYYNEWASPEEKDYFTQKIKDIVHTSLTKITLSYEEFQKYIMSIELKEIDFIYLNNSLHFAELTTLIRLIGKNIFELGVKHKWLYQNLLEDCKNNNISFNDFKIIAKYYAEHFLGLTKESCNDENKGLFYKAEYPIYAQVLDKILILADVNEINNLIKKHSINPRHIFRYCYHHNKHLAQEEQQILETRLLRIYQDYLTMIDNPHPYAKYYLNYLSGIDNYKKFCKDHNINISNFKKCLEHPYNLLYKNQVLTRINEEKKYLLERWLELIVALKTSQEKWGRPFDYLDYFIYFSDLATLYQGPPKEFENDFSKTWLNDFFKNYKTFTIVNKEVIINSYVEVMTLEGAKKILTKEELATIIAFLEQNNIPLYDGLINIAIRRYVNNTLLETYNRQAN